jgi:DNA-binding NarL/FixJ family response regulator
VRSIGGLTAALEGGIRHAIVDLTARAYDGVEAVAAASARGASVLAVGQHDDPALRKRALAAGAAKVLAYRKLADDGPGAIGAWLDAGEREHATATAEQPAAAVAAEPAAPTTAR